MLYKKRGVSQTIQLTEQITDAVQGTADTRGTSFASVVRACGASELQKRKARERAQKSKGDVACRLI